jgi:lactate racemase
VTAAAHVVKPQGSILLVGACQEGAGAPEFQRMLRSGLSDAQFLDHIQSAPVEIDQWQLEKLALVTTRRRLLWYVPGLPSEFHSSLWGRAFPTAPAAVAELVSTLPPGANIAVIPEGPYVLAKAAV